MAFKENKAVSPRRLMWLALALLATAQVQIACGETVLKVGLESEIVGFDPLKTRVMGLSTLSAGVTMLETLVRMDADGNLRPGLAESLQPSADGLTWTAVLRKNVLFHDLSPLTGDAVAFHFNRLLDPANRCACRFLIAPLATVVATAPLEVEFRLKAPWAALPAVLSEPSVVALIGSQTAILDGEDAYGRAPVGTGPYRFAGWQAGDRLTVSRFRQYRDDQAAGFDRIEFRVLPDHQTRYASIKSGDVDIIWTLHARSVTRARKDNRLKVLSHTGGGARLLVLNTTRGPLQDERVRRALAHSVDNAALVRTVFGGLTPIASDPYGDQSRWACGDPGAADYSPDKSRALLADYGKPVTLTFTHTATPRGREIGQILQQFWRIAGIDVSLKPVQQNRLLADVIQGDYDIGAWRVRDSIDPDPDVYGLFHSASPFNVTGFKSSAIDQLIEQQRATLDSAERHKTLCKLASLINDRVPVIYLAGNRYFAIARHDLTDVRPLLGGVLDVSNARLAPQ